MRSRPRAWGRIAATVVAALGVAAACRLRGRIAARRARARARLTNRRGRRLRSRLGCRLGFYTHDVERFVTATGYHARCRRCGVKAASVIELLDPKGEDGYVAVERLDQRARLRHAPEPRPREEFLRGRRFV